MRDGMQKKKKKKTFLFSFINFFIFVLPRHKNDNQNQWTIQLITILLIYTPYHLLLCRASETTAVMTHTTPSMQEAPQSSKVWLANTDNSWGNATGNGRPAYVRKVKKLKRNVQDLQRRG